MQNNNTTAAWTPAGVVEALVVDDHDMVWARRLDVGPKYSGAAANLKAVFPTPACFSLEENASTGFKWDVESNTNECTVVLKHRGGDKGATCGAPGCPDTAQEIPAAILV